MYPISESTLNLFKKNYRQVANIIFRKNGRTFTLTEANILQGGLSIDRYSVSGSKIEIGSAISAELKLKLDNRNGAFEDEIFEGAELEVQIGIKKWDAYKWENAQIEWIPCGFFTVDDPPRKLSSISLSALDRMVKFDCPIATSGIFPTSVQNLVRICCSHCGVLLETDLSSLPNKDYMITYTPEEDEELTYRQLLQWAAEIMGTCAYIDWNGKLRLDWYHTTDTSIVASDRYNSDIYENDITISGIQITDNDEETHLAGTDDYAFNITGNKLITHDYETVVTTLNTALNGFTYRPYSCTVKPMPHLYPMDKITYTDKAGTVHNTIITNSTFKMNMSTALSGKGETNKKSTYSAVNPLNKQESIVLQRIKKKMTDGDASVTQSFQAADGVLDSRITAEVTRATGVESTLSSSITQTAESISAEVTRAGAAEDALSSRITLNVSAITSEVSRASNAESSLSSRITQASDAITAEVTRATGVESTLSSSISILSGEISSKVSATGGTNSSFAWSLTSSGFSLIADDTTVMSVTSTGLSIRGSITALSGSIGGFTIGGSNLYSDSAVLGKVTIGNTLYPVLGIGSWNGNTFTAISSILGNSVISQYGVFQEVNAEKLSLQGNIEAISIRANKVLAPADISSSTGFYFGWDGGSTTYHATLSWSSGSRILYLKIYNSSGTQVNLTQSRSFTVHYACIWGGDTTWTATVSAGNSSTSKDTSAFWGIDYARFDSSNGSTVKYFTVSGSSPERVITCRGDIVTYAANAYDLGSATWYWRNIYLQSAPIVTSDSNLKNSITPLSDAYETIFDALTPVSFKYNENTSNRTHTGLIAQDLKQAILSAGLTTQDVAAYCEWIDKFGNTGCAIRYEELVALCIKEIQKLKTKVAILENTGG